MIILLSVGLKSAITAAIIIFLIALFIFDKRLIEKNRDAISGKLIVLSYFILFLLTVAAIISIMFLWGFSLDVTVEYVIEQIEEFFTQSISRILGSIIAIFIAMLINKIVKIALLRVGKSNLPNDRRKKTIAKLMISVVKYVVGIITIIAVLAIWGVNVGPALAGLGVLGLVIGLGAQKFINDLISGFFIIFENHFNVGDTIEVKGFKGVVTDIGLKTTKIRNWKGEIKIYNNGDIGDITNFSLNPSIAVVEFGIAYEEDVQKTTEILTIELPKVRNLFEQIIEDPVVVGVTEIANSSVNIRVIAKTLNEQHYAVERGIRKFIKEILDSNDIKFAFPQIVVHNAQSKKDN